jgi:thiosulfate/3-mercaptopyruvate sulfurtransferase
MPEEKLASRWLVSTEWLSQHLGDPNVIVLDGSYYLANAKRDAEAEFLAGHIPGAQRFDIDAISDKSNPLPHMLPPPEQFAAQVGALGVGDGMTIVLYDGIGLYGAARVWWTFRAFGSENVRVLDGGMPKWKAENRPLEAGAAKPRGAKTLTPKFNRALVASIDDVQKVLLDKTAQVVDARAADRFRGEAPEPRAGLRGGHMPGSFNVPFGEVLKDGRLKSHDAIGCHRLDPQLRDRSARQAAHSRLRRLVVRVGRASRHADRQRLNARDRWRGKATEGCPHHRRRARHRTRDRTPAAR